MEMSVLERQRAVLKWQQDHLHVPNFTQHQTYFTDYNMLSQPLQNFGAADTLLNDLLTTRPIKPDPGFEPGSGSGSASCPPTATSKKRKTDHKLLPPKQQAERDDENRAKKVKGNCEEEELVPKSSKNGKKESKNKQGSSSKDDSKASEPQKPDYIHVRARRGQATDSHSLAERVRREKISERMKYLQDLVPGCNKITGKAGMLDEIINYVQSLQRQVEFLSMKLAAVNPTLDFNIEEFFAKEAFQTCSSNFPGSGISTEMANLAYLQYTQGQPMVPVCRPELGMSEVEMGLRRTISAPVSMPETFHDSSCLTQQIQSYLPWDQSDAQTMYNNMEFEQARQQSFPAQTYTGAN